MSEDKEKSWLQVQQERKERLKAIAQNCRSGDGAPLSERLTELQAILEEARTDVRKPSPEERAEWFEQLRQKYGPLPADQLIARGLSESLRDIQTSAQERRQPGVIDLCMAVMHGDLEKVRSLLDIGMDVNSIDSSGHSLLMSAAICGQDEIVQMLMSRGATVRLLEAVLLQDYTAARTLLDSGFDVEQGDRRGITALQWAASRGCVPLVELLLEHGADVNSKSKSGHTALMRAAIRDHAEVMSLLRSAGAFVGLVEAAMLGETAMVRSLLERGEEIETRSDAEMTPLMAAAACGHLDTVKCLLDLGADRYAVTRFGHTPLAWAVIYNRFEVVNLFLDLGLNINTPFVSDNAYLNSITVLHMAVGRSNESMLRLLLARGANVHRATANAQTALHYAVMYRNIRAIEVLLDAGVDINARDSRSRTPLMIGVEMHHGRHGEEIVRLLLDRGADVNATQDHGWTALTQAARYGSKAIVEMLLDAGADINAVDTHGCSILASAAQEGNTEIAAFLKTRGAKIDTSPFGDLFGAALFGHQDVLDALRNQKMSAG